MTTRRGAAPIVTQRTFIRLVAIVVRASSSSLARRLRRRPRVRSSTMSMMMMMTDGTMIRRVQIKRSSDRSIDA